ncbi:S-ADENOSYL-L-METHIONINE-DEPENDENT METHYLTRANSFERASES SUPERFAMILY PROTEIN [Salix viminalis]|uniref:S-ADENOSYL-L-METHIONINE-DEPENDENT METHYLTRANSFERASES SUPERFAMILY PROTEIN n=1 Tax=Salix viminalis TaxID=40686 RepID=A0A9Q0TZW0_SALVM|nr:S-ADENOSYL-L-METHIONINE-DEPENDENT METHYLTRANSFERASES SUPERFAMILY PROTEIN [Salix viminalis]
MGTSTQAYGEPWYWDNRYSSESGSFDWYQKYPSLAPLINLYIPRHVHPRILVVGCGNSAFSEGMVSDGYEDVVNIDISSVILDMDVRDMSEFQSGSFDAVIDKGTLDSILCGNDSRNNAPKMLKEVWRVLKDNGVYILVTYGAPVYRLQLLRDSCSWRIKLHVIDKLLSEEGSEHPIQELTNPVPIDDSGSSVEAVLGKNPDVHYIYVCTKDESLKPE